MKKFIALSIIVFFVVLVGGGLWNGDEKPHSYFSLDQTAGTIATNNITQNLNGTYVDNGGLSLDSVGLIGTGMNITNRSNSYLNISYSRDMFEVGNWSVSLWLMKETVQVPGTTATIVSNTPSGTGTFRAGIDQASDSILFRTWNITNSSEIITWNSPTIGLWQHYVFTKNGTDLSIWNNGTLVNQTAYTGDSSSIHAPITIGGRSASTERGVGGIIDEVGIWNKSLTASEISSLYNGGLGVAFNQETLQGITVKLLSPDDNSAGGSASVLMNASHTPVNLTMINTTLSIWDSSNNLDKTTIALTGATINISSINYTFANPGIYQWNYETCGNNETNPTKIVCAIVSSNRTITEAGTAVVTTYPLVYETEFKTLEQNITSEFTISSATLLYNTTQYAGTITSVGSNYSLRGGFDIPTSKLGAQQFNWNITYSNGFVQNLSQVSQEVAAINLSLMTGGAPQNYAYINFTFKNETTAQESVTASIPRSAFTYFLGSGAVNKTLSLTEASEFNNLTLAFNPANRTLNISVDMDYDNSVSQQRTFNPESLFSLSNSTTDQVLFLLPTSDGIFVTFQVINQAQQPISGANVRLDKSGTLVSETQTGASGTTNVFLNPNTPYTLNVTKDGFTGFATTQTFPTTEFTLTLTTSSTGTDESFSQGVLFNILPPPLLLQNDTDVTFSFEINSTFLNLQEFGFDLINSTGSLIARNTTSGVNYGKVSSNNNTGSNSQLIMNYYWKVNGTYVNSTATWGVTEFGEGSITGFINRFKAYMDDGMFGGGTFTRALIIFLSIFLITGTLSFSFGLRAPEAIIGIGALTVALFDFGFGLIDFGFPGAIPHLATFLSFMVLIAVWLGRNR